MSITIAPERSRIDELVPYFLRLGLLDFGGPVALVGQMERELVAEHGIGTILGACFLLGKIAIGDWLTAVIGAASLAGSIPLECGQPTLDRGDGRHRLDCFSVAAAHLGDDQIANSSAVLHDTGRKPTGQ